MKQNNIFQDIPVHLTEESFQSILSAKHVKIERIVSKGHTSPKSGWYDQDSNEWVILLKGNAEIQFFNGNTLRLEAGDYIHISAHDRHKVIWTDPAVDSVWLAIHYRN